MSRLPSPATSPDRPPALRLWQAGPAPEPPGYQTFFVGAAVVPAGPIVPPRARRRSARPAAAEQLAPRVLALLRERDGLKGLVIARRLGVPFNATLRGLLSAMCKAGQLRRRRGRCGYFLPHPR